MQTLRSPEHIASISVLLLAAGRGTRLQPLTEIWPKCLMPINGHPLLEYWLKGLISLGIGHILVNVHSHRAKVLGFLARDEFLTSVKPVYEPRLLGTAGTLRANTDFFRDRSVLLIHADNWCHCDFRSFIDFHLEKRLPHCPITMMTFDSDNPSSCGVVETDRNGVVIAFHEKVSDPPSNRANAAVYMVEPEVLQWLESEPAVNDFSTEVLPNYLGRIATWHNAEIHRDIGTLSELRAAQSDLSTIPFIQENDLWQRNFEASAEFKALMEHIDPKEMSIE